MSGWACFIVKPTSYFKKSLRRYAGIQCPRSGSGYHEGIVVVDPQVPEGALGGEFFTEDLTSSVDNDLDPTDPRWPRRCGCGYAFHPEDSRQTRIDRLYGTGAGDDVMFSPCDRDVPPGAMWDATWLGGRYRGPDGKAWMIRLPAGEDWMVFGSSQNGSRWTITGEAPLFTAHPSIHLPGRYHGRLACGVLSPDLDGRKFQHYPETDFASSP